MIEVENQKRNAKAQRVKLKTQRKGGRQRYWERSKETTKQNDKLMGSTKKQAYLCVLPHPFAPLRFAYTFSSFALSAYGFNKKQAYLCVLPHPFTPLRFAYTFSSLALRAYGFNKKQVYLCVSPHPFAPLRFAYTFSSLALRVYV